MYKSSFRSNWSITLRFVPGLPIVDEKTQSEFAEAILTIICSQNNDCLQDDYSNLRSSSRKDWQRPNSCNILSVRRQNYVLTVQWLLVLRSSECALQYHYKTRCQIWGTIEFHRDPVSKVLSVSSPWVLTVQWFLILRSLVRAEGKGGGHICL